MFPISFMVVMGVIGFLASVSIPLLWLGIVSMNGLFHGTATG
jgi:hypothetical protein